MDPLNMMRARLLQAHQQGLFNQQNSAPNLGINSMFPQALTPEHAQLLSGVPRPSAAIQQMLMPRHMVAAAALQRPAGTMGTMGARPGYGAR